MSGVTPVLPDGLADKDRVVLEGVDGSRRGAVSMEGYTGRFDRQASVSTVNGVTNNRFDASFSLAGPGGEQVIAICQTQDTTQERTNFLGLAVDVAVLPYVYDCELDAGDGQAGRLVVGEVTTSTFQPAGERVGSVQLGARLLTIRSNHAVQQTKMRAGPPVGYLFYEDDVAVAAVDLTGARPVLILPEAGETRRLAALAGLALALIQEG